MSAPWNTQHQYWLSLKEGCQNGLALIGLFSVFLLALHAFGPELSLVAANAEPMSATATNAGSLPVVASKSESLELANAPATLLLSNADPQYEPVAKYIARNYRIATEAAEELITVSLESAKMVGLDPVLLLAVMAIESRFNPIAESHMGAKGLMQVMPSMHLDKLANHGGRDVALDPWINIYVGAQILQEYIQRSGSLEAGLQLYNGAAADPGNQYALKVLGERDRLQQLLPRSARHRRTDV
jgi:soluble lytic murein transglycosylase-like protein